MSTIDDSKLINLKALSFNTSLSDGYRAYLVAYSGVSTGTLQDLEKTVLTSLGYSGAVDDMWYDLLTDKGYTGTLNDMFKFAWENDVDIFGVGDYVLLENGNQLLQENGYGLFQ